MRQRKESRMTYYEANNIENHMVVDWWWDDDDEEDP